MQRDLDGIDSLRPISSALPTAQLHRSGSQVVSAPPATPLRHRLTPARILRGVILGPLVAYMLLSTALLYAVSQLEAIAVWLARQGNPNGIAWVHQTQWHDGSMWLIIGSPVLAPFLALRALAMVVLAGGYALARGLVRLGRWPIRALRAIARWLNDHVLDALWAGIRRVITAAWRVCGAAAAALRALRLRARELVRSSLAWIRASYRDAWASIVSTLKALRGR